ncbi:MAG: cytochrome P450 [Jatrophihabitans sp.]
MTTQSETSLTQPEIDALLDRLGEPETSADPYPLYARLRELGPLQTVVDGAPVLFLSRYDDCAAGIRGTQFGAQTPEWCERATPGWLERPVSWAFEAMLFLNPPDHTRLRRLVGEAFAPRRVEQMRDQVSALARLALDRLADAGADGGVVDLQQLLASTLPVSMIGSYLGVPEADWADLRRMGLQILHTVEFAVTEADLATADGAAIELRDYFAELTARRRAAPREDLTSDLLAIRDQGSDAQFSERELVLMLANLFLGGVDTMTNLLANGCAALLGHPAQAALLRQRPELAAGAVDEVLRFDAPVQVIGRVADTDTAIAGQPIRASQLVVSIVGAANRDARRFADPDLLDISRDQGQPLSFGGGIHYCLGAPLARAEAASYFAGLVSRFPAIELAGEPTRAGMVFRRFERLPVTIS